MFYYNRQIVYMDLWKAGERAGNAGFLKLEETDRGLRWQMRIRGLGESDTGFLTSATRRERWWIKFCCRRERAAMNVPWSRGQLHGAEDCSGKSAACGRNFPAGDI